MPSPMHPAGNDPDQNPSDPNNWPDNQPPKPGCHNAHCRKAHPHEFGSDNCTGEAALPKRCPNCGFSYDWTGYCPDPFHV